MKTFWALPCFTVGRERTKEGDSMLFTTRRAAVRECQGCFGYGSGRGKYCVYKAPDAKRHPLKCVVIGDKP